MSRCNASFAVHTVLMCISTGLAALLSFPATAELPTHARVARLLPTPVESGTDVREHPNSPGFGAAVAIRNSTAFVGIPSAFPTSRVAVYGQTASGWVRTATLTVTDPVPVGARGNGFGSAIAFRDGVAVIASHSLLHVLKRGNGVWTDVQQLRPPPQVGVTPGFWNISAMRYENGILAVGSSSFVGDSVVYLYELASTGKFVRRATLRASDAFPGDTFGVDVAVAGNTLVVGAPAHQAAYVFRRRSDGSWVETQKLTAPSFRAFDEFGAAVAIDRGMIIVGDPGHDCIDTHFFCSGGRTGENGEGAGGAAYGFVPIEGQYVQVFKLRPRPDEHFNYFRFGRRIAMFDKHIVIDADQQSLGGDPDFIAFPDGLSFSYRRDGSVLTPRGITHGYVESNSMALANNWLLVGSRHDHSDSCQAIEGACFGQANIFDLNRFAQ